ncbi:trypsin-like serine protease [Chryseobacterium luquanense]|uniref:Trypsin-like serine protease n=1 Tax=Chryseobacterium luquanense TaxID=2983766 RepID=A0ABT3Y1Y6_9FLAO|nr:trypsin-like serine protease [Chryseobacterium luquanense]MCX8532164.1 trypsin-like serine protease [Chryseobacterium luquanense]
MTDTILTQLCVRITIVIDGKNESHGSGVILKFKENYYVITAFHCIYGNEKQFQNVKLSEIKIEEQKAFNTPFSEVEIQEIVAKSEVDDWVLLKLKNIDTRRIFPNVSICDEFKFDTPVAFTGFQNINKNQSRSYKGRVLNEVSGREFRITLTHKDTFKAGSDDAKGLSGSGAFIIMDDKLFLIGILKSVLGDDASNDDIKCCSLTEIAQCIGLEVSTVIMDQSLDYWGSNRFNEIGIIDNRDLGEKIKAVNTDFSNLQIKILCQQLALGKSELMGISERDLSAIKYRIFEECQEELQIFLEENDSSILSDEQIKNLIERYTDRGVEILDIKSKKYKYPILDTQLIKRIVLDLINECYLSFDKEGVYDE